MSPIMVSDLPGFYLIWKWSLFMRCELYTTDDDQHEGHAA